MNFVSILLPVILTFWVQSGAFASGDLLSDVTGAYQGSLITSDLNANITANIETDYVVFPEQGITPQKVLIGRFDFISDGLAEGMYSFDDGFYEPETSTFSATANNMNPPVYLECKRNSDSSLDCTVLTSIKTLHFHLVKAP